MGGFLAVFLLALVGSAVVVRRVRRKVRVLPTVASRAPLSWSYSPGLAASQHRRLRTAAAIARVTGDRSDTQGWVNSEFPALVRALQEEAAHIETQLIRVSSATGRARRQLLEPVTKRIDAYETTVARLVATADDWSSCTQVNASGVMSRVEERIEAVRRSTEEIRLAEGPASLTPPPLSPPTRDNRTALTAREPD